MQEETAGKRRLWIDHRHPKAEAVDHLQDDQETARQGRTTAVVGLVVQLFLVIAMAVVAAWSGGEALEAAAWHMLGGLPIWLMLVVVFGQREAERRESLAAEKLTAEDAASAALFGELSDELQRVRQRLANLVRYGLPAVSLFVGGYLVVAGGLLLWRFLVQAGQVDGPRTPVGGHPVGLLFASGAIAFVAFVAGRWISGCARVLSWRMLRGGASYLMSCFLVAGLVAVAATAAAVLADARFFQFLAAAVPSVMLVVGTEILLTSLLEVYRPRRPGELARPAFDSRLLGLLTAPESLGEVVGDLIRYQFGVEVSGSWLFRLLGRSLTPLVLLAGGVMALLSCLVVVAPDEEGLILRFGSVARPSVSAGIHLKLPWPVETAVTYPALRVLQVSVSSGLADRQEADKAILWTSGDDRLEQIGAEYYPTVLAASSAGGGLAVIDAELVVQFRVRDLRAFLQTSPAPEATVAVLAQQASCRYFASHDLEFLLSRGRVEAGPRLAAAVQRQADALGLGLEIVDVSITALQPPGGPVARAFHRQVAAQQERETLIERARRDAVATLSQVAGSVSLAQQLDRAILELDAVRVEGGSQESVRQREGEIERLLGEARGEAAELLHLARGARWTRAVGEQAAEERFQGELMAYRQAPAYYRATRTLGVLAAGLADRRKFVVPSTVEDQPVFRMDFADPAAAIETLLGE